MKVLLVCMPFGPVFSPSIGLSLVRGSLERDGIDTELRYFSIRFAEMIGRQTYDGIESGQSPRVTDLAGEWLFARALFGAAPDDDDGYVERILRRRGDRRGPAASRPVTEAAIRRLLAARDHVVDFLDGCLDEVVAARPEVVGFSSVFQQHVASLALARRVKEALPGTFILFGGANCEGTMGAETVRRCSFVDAAVSGEGEVVVPQLVRRVLAGAPVDGLPGVRTRRGLEENPDGPFGNAPVPPSLDDLPDPDFTDYMGQFRASRFHERWKPTLPFETSRGCWWGAKHHCTFCGLNGATMAYRSKSPERALDELDRLTRANPGCEIQVVDTILDMKYLTTFLPALARRGPRASLMYETKANLKKDQLRLLREAGVTAIQPGIESFDDTLLRDMRKGVTSLQNVQLLKWCKEIGVEPIWNVLWGFPGEAPDAYQKMTALVRQLTHLPPPSGIEGVRLDRFSPIFDEARERGLVDVRPVEAYRFVYPFPDAALEHLAYFFRFRHRDGYEPAEYAGPFLRALRDWKRRHRDGDLFSIDMEDRLLVCDGRTQNATTLVELEGIDRALYLACDQIAEFGTLAARARREGAGGDEVVREHLEALVARGLMITDRDRYLALAIPVGEYRPAKPIAARFLRKLRGEATAPCGASIRVEGRVSLARPRTARLARGPIR